MIVAVAIKIDESQRWNLIAHDVPIAFASLHVEALKEAIPSDDDVHLIWIIKRSDHYGPYTIFNLI